MEHKIKKTLSREALGRYLHTLADAVRNPQAVHDRKLAMLQDGFDKLELKCRRNAEKFEIKLKLKTDARGTPPMGEAHVSPPGAPEAYKALKKRMQATFKDLGAALSENRLPSEPLIHAFREEVLQMIRYPDRGEPHYEAFEAACRKLTEACRRNRIEEARQAYEALIKMKKDCHTRYK